MVKKMKRLSSILIAFAVVFSLMLPGFAATNNPFNTTMDLRGKAVVITSENGTGIMTIGNSKYPIDENTVLYSSGDMVLYLKNVAPVTISQIQAGGKVYFKSNGYNYNYYGGYYGYSPPTQGGGILNVVSTTGTAVLANDLYAYSGSGCLNAQGADYGVRVNNSITLNGFALNAQGGDTAIYANNCIQVNGSAVNAVGGNTGIYSGSTKSANALYIFCNGQVTATGQNGPGVIASAGGIKVTGSASKLTAQGATDGIVTSGGVCRSLYVLCGAQVYAEGFDGAGIKASNGEVYVSDKATRVTGIGTTNGISLTDTNKRIISYCYATITGITTGLQDGYSAIQASTNLYASCGGTLHEIYKDSGIVFTPEPLNINKEYIAIGRNMNSFLNYQWTSSNNGIKVQTDGLVAVKSMDNEKVIATRMGKAANEAVSICDKSSKHIVEIDGTRTTISSEYTVNYLDVETNEVIRLPETKQADIGTTVMAANEAVAIEYYEFRADATEPSITIKANAAENVLNLYYERAEADYVVKYYKDSIDGEFLGEIPGKGKIGTQISPKLDEFVPDETYIIPGEIHPSSQLTITEDPSANVVYVVYKQKDLISYNIDYYYTDIEGNEYQVAPMRKGGEAHEGSTITLTDEQLNFYKEVLSDPEIYSDGVQVDGPVKLVEDGQIIKVLYKINPHSTVHVNVYYEKSANSGSYDFAFYKALEKPIGEVITGSSLANSLDVDISKYVFSHSNPLSITVVEDDAQNTIHMYYNVKSSMHRMLLPESDTAAEDNVVTSEMGTASFVIE